MPHDDHDQIALDRATERAEQMTFDEKIDFIDISDFYSQLPSDLKQKFNDAYDKLIINALMDDPSL